MTITTTLCAYRPCLKIILLQNTATRDIRETGTPIPSRVHHESLLPHEKLPVLCLLSPVLHKAGTEKPQQVYKFSSIL